MRLRDAILSGASLKGGSDPSKFLLEDGTGCALGGALLAEGVNGRDFLQEQMTEWKELCATNNNSDWYQAFKNTKTVKRLWPWMTYEQIAEISRMYKRVCHGDITLEEVAAYADLIEPKENNNEVDQTKRSDGAGEHDRNCATLYSVR